MSEGKPQTAGVGHVRSQSGDDPFRTHDTLRSFGKQSRRRIGLERPAPLHDMVRRPQARLCIDEPALEHALHWHRRTGNNTDLARVNGVRAKQTTLRIAAARNHWNARLQTQVGSRIFAERPKRGA